MADIGFGIVGCGLICNQHVDAINQTPGAVLAGFCDVVEEKAKDFGNAFNAPHYSTLDDLLRDDNVSAVCLCTPSSFHAEAAVAAARAGKHVLTEKPMAISKKDTDSMITACKEAGVKFGVVYQRRMVPRFALMKKVIEEGELGKPVLGSVYMKYYRGQDYYDSGDWRGTWEFDGGGCLMNQGIHMIDMLLWFMGPAKSVNGKVATLARNIEVEDVATATVEFQSGALGTIEATTAAYPNNIPHRLEIHGDRGSIMILDEKISRWQIIGDDGLLNDRLETASEEEKAILEQEDDWNDGHRALIADMVQAINEDRPPLVPGEEGRKALDMILAIYESSKGDKTIEFLA